MVFVVTIAIKITSAPTNPIIAAQTDAAVAILTAFVTLLVIGIGSLTRMYQIGGNGVQVALMLGGTPVQPSTEDPLERRLMNVVEEMAIASGIPVPRVFILKNEPGINAFAAGLKPGEAVIGVTRGTVEQLTRDELQGVVAHEFSHIFNGDMRMNIHLMGVLGGILALTTVGRVLLDSMRGTRSDGEKKGSATPFVLIALALIVLGYIGVFFARLIKAAVSRQREYLADASAVQYTRNPGGIGGALMKIRGFTNQSIITSAYAEEASHLFFGSALKFSAMFATHPALEERITRINPLLLQDGNWTAHSALAKSDSFTTSLSDEAAMEFSESALAAPGSSQSPEAKAPRSQTEAAAARASAIVQTIGMPGLDDLTAAKNRLAGLPQSVREQLKTIDGALSGALALFLQSESGSAAQNAMIGEAYGETVLQLAQAMHRDLGDFVHTERLTLLELAIPSLRLMEAEKKRVFLILCRDLVHADGRYDLFEYVALTLLDHQLFGVRHGRKPRTLINAARTTNDISVVVSAIAYAGSNDITRAKAAFDAGIDSVRATNSYPISFRSPDECRLPAIADAIERLSYLEPAPQKTVVDACVRTIIHDKVVNQEEAELLKVLCTVLEAPLPALAV